MMSIGNVTRVTMNGRGGALLLLAACGVATGGLGAARADPGGAPGAATGDLTVTFSALRSAKGMIRACLTRNPAYFPNCERDPAALKGSVPARTDARLTFAAVAPGDYALMVLHDENGNSKVDTMLGIPREGVGFSRNPVLRFGPPKWDATVIHIPVGPSTTAVKLKYFL